MLSMDLWLGLTMVLPQISWIQPEKILRLVIALRFGARPKPPCFNIHVPSARLQTNKILILQPLQLRLIQKSNHSRRAALPEGSHQLQKAGRAGTRQRNTFAQSSSGPSATPHCYEDAAKIPPSLWQDEESLSTLERENTKRKKKFSEVWLHNILDPWSMPSLLTTT